MRDQKREGFSSQTEDFYVRCTVGQSELKPQKIHHIENLSIYLSKKNTDWKWNISY